MKLRSRSDPNDLSKEQVAKSLALLLLGLVGRMADGDEGNGSMALGSGEGGLESFGVVVAHPASAQTALGSCQAEVLNGNRCVNVAVWFVVKAAHPLRLRMAIDVVGCRGRLILFAVVAGPQAAQLLRRREVAEKDGLKVDR